MTRRIALLVMVLSLMVPVVATADIVFPVDYWVRWDATGWHEVWNDPGYSFPYGFPPTWQGRFDPNDTIVVDNDEARLTKHIYLEIDYSPQLVQLPETPPIELVVEYDESGLPPKFLHNADATITRNDAGKSITWHWSVWPQPGKDELTFLDVTSTYNPYYNLVQGGDVVAIEFATYCIPLPNTAWMGLSVMGCLMAVYGWRKARKT